jgi:hypothetical protein
VANDLDRSRGLSEDGVSHADESSEDGRLPALRCGVFHEKACRGLYIKRFTFFEDPVWGLAAFPEGQASIRTRGGDLKLPRGAGRNPKVFGKGMALLTGYRVER